MLVQIINELKNESTAAIKAVGKIKHVKTDANSMYVSVPYEWLI